MWSYDGAGEWLDTAGKTPSPGFQAWKAVAAKQARVAALEAVAYSDAPGSFEAHCELWDEALPELEAAVGSVSHIGNVGFFTRRPLPKTSRLVTLDGIRMWADSACSPLVGVFGWREMAADVADVMRGRPTSMYSEALLYLAHGHVRVIDGVPMDVLAGFAAEVENAG